MDRETGSAQTAGHALAHGTQTDHPYLFHRLHLPLLKTPSVAELHQC
jgi:hypothetical protein